MALDKEKVLVAVNEGKCVRINYIYRRGGRLRTTRRTIEPYSYGITSRGNEVLFAIDVDDPREIKSFITKQVRSTAPSNKVSQNRFPNEIG